jgi:regulator of protease activity HflC (stomatin/prohibitin superfamily)
MYSTLRKKLNRIKKKINYKSNLNKEVMKRILVAVGLVVLLVVGVFSCERIDAGHVGVKVNLYGSGKGVSDVTECTGLVFYNPMSTKIYEFPTYIQHKEYKKSEEGDNSFIVNSKDGSEFSVSPIMNYSVQREKVPTIFAKYRRSLPEIEEGFLKTAVYDAFRLAANKYTADGLISNREVFETEVRRILVTQLQKEGFVLNQFTSNLIYPDSFKKAINAKNNAVQSALMAENKVKQAEAEAKIKVATANGNAEALLANARAEAESNRLRQQTLTPMLIQQQWIEKWKGNVPTTQLGSNTSVMYGLK